MSRVHVVKDKNYICDICGFKTAEQFNLARHKKIHDKLAVKRCQYCDFTARTKDRLECHIDKKHQDVGGNLR